MHTTVNTAALPQAFSDALKADLSALYGIDPLPARWTAFGDAVAVVTRQMRLHGYYPETVLAAIKSAVQAAAVPLVADHVASEIVRDAAQLCIHAYFEPEVDQAVPAFTAKAAVRVPRGVETPGTSQRSALPEPRP